jgi:hypothetical protein
LRFDFFSLITALLLLLRVVLPPSLPKLEQPHERPICRLVTATQEESEIMALVILEARNTPSGDLSGNLLLLNKMKNCTSSFMNHRSTSTVRTVRLESINLLTLRALPFARLGGRKKKKRNMIVRNNKPLKSKT